MGLHNLAPGNAGGDCQCESRTLGGLGTVGVQDLEPWLDLSSQGSVEMTSVLRWLAMTTPAKEPTALPWAILTPPHTGLSWTLDQPEFLLTPQGSHIIAHSDAMGTNARAQLPA